MEKTNSLAYQYAKMELDQFAFFEENYKEGSDIGFNNLVQFAFDSNQCIIRCNVTVNMESEGKPLLKTSFNNYFPIKKDTISSLLNEEKYVFPVNILVQFASLSYGSLRGVIFAKTQGTKLRNIVLPPFYMNEIIKEPLVIQKNSNE